MLKSIFCMGRLLAYSFIAKYRKFGRIFNVFFDSKDTTPYYCALMSDGTHVKRLPPTVDPRKLSRTAAVYDGVVPVSGLPRFVDAIHSLDWVKGELRFDIDERGKCVVYGELHAQGEVICQRCLEPAPLNISAKLSLGVVWDEDGAKQLPDDLDPWLVDDSDADLYSILEEELLLSLPAVSYHDYDCIDRSLLSQGDDETESTTAVESPFQVLAKLKQESKDD